MEHYPGKNEIAKSIIVYMPATQGAHIYTITYISGVPVWHYKVSIIVNYVEDR